VGTSRARRALAALLVLIPASLYAQTPQSTPQPSVPQAAQTAGEPTPAITFLSRYDFHLSADSIRSGNQPQDAGKFAWIANFGGDIDMVDYGRGRVNFLADYEMIAGRSHHVDPNQGNYTLDLSSSWRVKDLEIEAVFHHISRHLIDQAKGPRVAWNSLGVRVVSNYTNGPLTVRSHLHLAKMIETAYVDYRWEAVGGGRVDYRLNPHIAALGSASFDIIGVDPAEFGRSTQVGARVEAGVHVRGTGAAVEMFVAFDRRIDADPIDITPRNWVLLGFRLLPR
jgi:hypothetical protein